MNSISTATIVQVPLGRIVIGERRREKLGRLQALAKSIKEHGLIHPILLRGETLVAGHRRLEACRSLGWKTIPARQVDRLSNDELRAIELDENTARENLSDYATSKDRLAQIRQAEADLKAKAAKEADELRATSVRKSRRRGRPKEPGSQRTVAEETGISQAEQVRVERHVELGERYPFLQRRGWSRTHVLDAGDALERITEQDRAPLCALLDQDAIPPAKVLEYLGYAATMPTARRRDIINLAASPDEFERRRALTMLANVPAPPDPGLVALVAMEREGRRAVAGCRSERYKGRITALAEQTTDLLNDFGADEQAHREATYAETV